MKDKIRKLDVLGIIRKFGDVFYVLIFAFLVLIAGLVAITSFNIPGNYKMLIVRSGSMEPTLKTGGIIIIKPEEIYQKNDIITISEPANSKVTLTHRIVGIEKKDRNVSYITKGDANEDPDLEKRPSQSVVGRVLFSLPILGYIVDFAKTKNGLLLLIIIPCLLIICSEILNIGKEVSILIRKRKVSVHV